ncbi:MAG: hypothetical protein JAZ03_14475, partial [Candidatus Thiodiazotropha taylori]|nr:hypothetical protein [Candidatus Thiodiazotropha taylori]MCW4335136.1 hypothetical protein [Candidatus Thiodiazotropha endolucinida]
TCHQYRIPVNESFLTLESDLSLNQIIDSPTRGDNILDLFSTNRPSIVNRSSVIPGISDHHAINVDSHITTTRQKPVKQTIFMWEKANIQGLKRCANSYLNQLSASIHPKATLTTSGHFSRKDVRRYLRITYHPGQPPRDSHNYGSTEISDA